MDKIGWLIVLVAVFGVLSLLVLLKPYLRWPWRHGEQLRIRCSADAQSAPYKLEPREEALFRLLRVNPTPELRRRVRRLLAQSSPPRAEPIVAPTEQSNAVSPQDFKREMERQSSYRTSSR